MLWVGFHQNTPRALATLIDGVKGRYADDEDFQAVALAIGRACGERLGDLAGRLGDLAVVAAPEDRAWLAEGVRASLGAAAPNCVTAHEPGASLSAPSGAPPVAVLVMPRLGGQDDLAVLLDHAQAVRSAWSPPALCVAAALGEQRTLSRIGDTLKRAGHAGIIALACPLVYEQRSLLPKVRLSRAVEADTAMSVG